MRDQVDEPGEKPHKDARARVRIVRELRGSMPFDSFTLVGGPYDSCRIGGPEYRKFAVGERWILMLDGPVPERTRVIVPWWSGRLSRRPEAEVREIMARLDVAWRKRLALLRRKFPDAEEADYATLLLAAELARNPSAPLPLPPEPPADPEDFSRRPTRDEFKYYTRSYEDPALPEDLDLAIASCRATRSAEVIRVHRRLVERWVTTELCQPEDRARRFAAAVTDESLLKAHFPVRDLKLTKDAVPDLVAVLALLRLADDEPDGLARSYGKGASAEIFAPWLKRNSDTAPTWGFAMRVYFDSHHPVAAPIVLRELRQDDDRWDLHRYLEFFLAVGSREGVAAVLAQVSRLEKRDETLMRRLIEVVEKSERRDQTLLDRLVALRDRR